MGKLPLLELFVKYAKNIVFAILLSVGKEAVSKCHISALLNVSHINPLNHQSLIQSISPSINQSINQSVNPLSINH